MAKWVFPPLEPDFDYVAAMRALASEEIRPVKRQHVVSKVVLKGFASLKGRRQGWQLARFDKRRCRELYPKGLDACGKIDGFVQYASGSAEALWDGVEKKLGTAIESAEAGALHRDEKNIKTIKQGIALHLVRTPHFRRIHESSFAEAVRALRKEMLENEQAMLSGEFRRRYGLEPAGAEARELVLDQPFQKWQEYEQTGMLLRVSLERSFYRVCSTLEEVAVQVLHVPAGKELIISDAPAFTFAYNPDGTMTTQMAIGDSHGVALPVTSKCLVAIGPEPKDEELLSGLVDNFNRIQVELAERQVYYKPSSSIKRFVEHCCRNK
ncbi:MAG: DUF4238 domain-containing protein [Pseudonocardiaceae bacterium]